MTPCRPRHALVPYGFIGMVARIPVSLAVLVYSTHPVLLAAISHWQGRERLAARKLVLALVALAALALVLGAGFDRLDATGVALGTFASAAVYGLILLSASAQRDATSTQVNFYMMAVTVVLFGTATTAGGTWSLPSGAVGWLGLAGAGVGVTVGLLAFLAAFRFIGPVRATMISNVEPVLGILFAGAVLGEHLAAAQWIGVALTLMALVLFEAPSGGVRRGRLSDRAGMQVGHPTPERLNRSPELTASVKPTLTGAALGRGLVARPRRTFYKR